MYPFERFTERAKKALTLAQEEAERSHHSYIGTEHLLLGLLGVENGVGAKVLSNLGVDGAGVRSAIDQVKGREERLIVQQIIPTTRVKKIIEISFEEARRMGNNHVGTEHLLLALLIEGEGIAAHVLDDLGITLEKARAEIYRLLLAPTTEEGAGPGEVPAGAESRRVFGTTRPAAGRWPGPGRAGAPGFFTTSPPSSPALNEIQAEAERLAAEQHTDVGPEHALLAALEADPLVRRMLAALGIDLSKVAEVRRIATPPERLIELRRAYHTRVAAHSGWRGLPPPSASVSRMVEQRFHGSDAERDELQRLGAELEEAERRWRAGEDKPGSGGPGPEETAP